MTGDLGVGGKGGRYRQQQRNRKTTTDTRRNERDMTRRNDEDDQDNVKNVFGDRDICSCLADRTGLVSHMLAHSTRCARNNAAEICKIISDGKRTTGWSLEVTKQTVARFSNCWILSTYGVSRVSLDFCEKKHQQVPSPSAPPSEPALATLALVPLCHTSAKNDGAALQGIYTTTPAVHNIIFARRFRSTYCIWRPFQRVLVSKPSIPASEAARKYSRTPYPVHLHVVGPLGSFGRAVVNYGGWMTGVFLEWCVFRNGLPVRVVLPGI
ncbi:hypothetical protein EDD85DRAFT_979870 [Armillaria nabsnona]|nr:hypothetical protein EDD85DRAFT_979870 [Armillaria nabsnona]